MGKNISNEWIKGVKLIKAECYLVMESDDYCRGVRFVLPSGEYFGIETKPHSIKLMNDVAMVERT